MEAVTHWESSCALCRRKLTSPASVRVGMGKTCRSKLGEGELPPPKPAQLAWAPELEEENMEAKHA